jgi:hypothetical protein
MKGVVAAEGGSALGLQLLELLPTACCSLQLQHRII